MIIAINSINNTAQEMTTVVFAQGGFKQKNEARKICCC